MYRATNISRRSLEADAEGRTKRVIQPHSRLSACVTDRCDLDAACLSECQLLTATYPVQPVTRFFISLRDVPIWAANNA
jgi:hypothetical protein